MNAGDVVRLKSGGESMTVAESHPGRVKCVYWLGGAGHRYLEIVVDCVELVPSGTESKHVSWPVELNRLRDARAYEDQAPPRGEDAELGIVSGMYDCSCDHPRNALAYALARHERYVQHSFSERPRWYARTAECATVLDPIEVMPSIRAGHAYGVLSDGGVIRVRLPCL